MSGDPELDKAIDQLHKALTDLVKAANKKK